MNSNLTKENYFRLGQVPKGIGAALEGWNILEKDFTNPSIVRRVADLRVMTAACLHNCFHCFTDKLKVTLSLEEIKSIIDQLADMWVKAIDFLGEGEPTLDKHFFEIIEYTASKGLQPIIFTDAATKMRDRSFVKRVKATWASVCPKCDSLRNEEYQNRVVWDKTWMYFQQRNEAIQLLIEEGFNALREDGTTRLWFDMVVSKRNIHEVEKTLRYCRENNIRVVFTTYLPSGRSGTKDFDKDNVLSEEDKLQLWTLVQKIDQEYGFNHKIVNNFFTTPCVEFLQIFGNGDVSACAGNPNVVGNIKDASLQELKKRILKTYPKHNCENCDGTCVYRTSV